MSRPPEKEPPSSRLHEDTFSSAKPGSGKLGRRGALTVTQRLVAKPDARNRTLLVRIDSADAGQVHSLNEDQFTLGRHPENNVCIDDQGLSRYHARLVKKGDKYWIEDLDSSNGTFVNGRRMTSCELTNGDTLQFGPRVSFRLSLASADEERVLKQLYESSVRDPLTQTFNRQYLAGQLTSEVSFALRHKTELSVLMLDVDFFKKINDGHGHQAGDFVLQTVARRLLHELRTEDILARYGGEEFVVLLRGVSAAGGSRAGERLRSAIAEAPVCYQGTDIVVTISVGCANLDQCEDQSPDGLLLLADKRLYAAKDAGRNCVVG